jgi:hypothetical protein
MLSKHEQQQRVLSHALDNSPHASEVVERYIQLLGLSASEHLPNLCLRHHNTHQMVSRYPVTPKPEPRLGGFAVCEKPHHTHESRQTWCFLQQLSHWLGYFREIRDEATIIASQSKKTPDLVNQDRSLSV